MNWEKIKLCLSLMEDIAKELEAMSTYDDMPFWQRLTHSRSASAIRLTANLIRGFALNLPYREPRNIEWKEINPYEHLSR